MSKLAKRVSGAIAQYDPDKSVKKIRLLEAVQKHWTKARDASRLEAAIKEKWNEQGEFVYWWDTQANKDQGGDHKSKLKKNNFDRLEDFGLDKFIVYQWRKVCLSPETIKAAIADDFQRALTRIERDRRAKDHQQHPTPEPTPFHWLNAVGDLRDLIEKAIGKWPDDARQLAPQALRDLADILEGEGSHARGGSRDEGAESGQGPVTEHVSSPPS